MQTQKVFGVLDLRALCQHALHGQFANRAGRSQIASQQEEKVEEESSKQHHQPTILKMTLLISAMVTVCRLFCNDLSC